MFEEVCLVCGKHLQDDGRAYCSEDCQTSDLYSPSISSSSSALSSPNMGYAAGGEVPPLMPSALGSALKSYAGRAGYYVSSSSASSTAWSIVSDDDEDAAQQCGSEYSYHDASDPISDTSSISTNFVYSTNPSALSYARKPSGTNHGPTVPRHQGSTSRHVRGTPRSAPIHSHVPSDDDDDSSDIGFSSVGRLDIDEQYSEEEDAGPKYPTISKAKRTRNRASLPACFSLLKMSSPSKAFRTSPVSSSSANTIARHSPPTPKIPASSAVSVVGPLTSVHATPRGRRREAGTSRSSRRSGRSSDSRSRSRARRVPATEMHEHALHTQGSVEQLVDWSSVLAPPHRGRATLRRNSSPLPRMPMGVEDPILTAVRRSECAEADRVRAGSQSRPRTRGRARVEDLEGFGTSTDAPGYGNGRSGLLNRERAHTHTARVPL